MTDIERRSRSAMDMPRGRMPVMLVRPRRNRDAFGRATEVIARAMGTPMFLIALTLFCALWILWNVTPGLPHFDQQSHGFTALTLVLSLQASYAAPLILLAQNRQDDRDRVSVEQDRRNGLRSEADTQYLLREVVALRRSLRDVATKDFVRDEIRTLVAERNRTRDES